MEFELETRACRQCLRPFKVLTTSPQRFHSELCEIEFVNKPGSKEAWTKKQEELKKRLFVNANGALPGQKEVYVQKAKELSQALKSSAKSGEKVIKDAGSIITESKCKDIEKTPSSKEEKINVEPPMNRNVLPPTLITRNIKEPIRGSGMKETEKNIKNGPSLIEGNATQLPAWTRQLKHVKEEISQQTNLLDSSAKLLYSQMEKSQGNPLDVVTYSQGIVNLMRAKTEAIKATTEIIKAMKEISE